MCSFFKISLSLLITELFKEKFDVYITDEILLEYHEILERKYSATTANNFIAALQLLQTVHFTHIYFRWQLLMDADDNKFADCAIAANADYLITNDRDFISLNRLISQKYLLLQSRNLKK